jgi:hypothetical protein
MTTLFEPTLSRRRFIVTTAGAAGGLMLGFHLPWSAYITMDNRMACAASGCSALARSAGGSARRSATAWFR